MNVIAFITVRHESGSQSVRLNFKHHVSVASRGHLMLKRFTCTRVATAKASLAQDSEGLIKWRQGRREGFYFHLTNSLDTRHGKGYGMIWGLLTGEGCSGHACPPWTETYNVKCWDEALAEDSSRLYNSVSVVTILYSQAHLSLNGWAIKEHKAWLDCLYLNNNKVLSSNCQSLSESSLVLAYLKGDVWLLV